MEINRMVRNPAIDFWKFLYSWCIVFYHFYAKTQEHLIGGWIGVEYYLLCAGVFFFRSVERNTDGEGRLLISSYEYLKKRFFRFFPWAFTAFFCMFIVSEAILTPGVTAGRILDHLSDDIWEILLVKMNGLNEGKNLLNVPAWTLSSMLIVEFVLWGILAHHRRVFIELYMPLSLLIGFGIWRQLESADVRVWTGLMPFGTMRAYLVICLSYYGFQLAKRLSKVSFNSYGEWALSLLELTCHGFSLFVLFFRSSRNYQWCAMLTFLVAISIALSGHSILDRLIFGSGRLCTRLGQWSLSIYLIHYTVYRLYLYVFPEPAERYDHWVGFFAATCLASLVHYLMTKLWITGSSKIWKTLTASLVEAE